MQLIGVLKSRSSAVAALRRLRPRGALGFLATVLLAAAGFMPAAHAAAVVSPVLSGATQYTPGSTAVVTLTVTNTGDAPDTSVDVDTTFPGTVTISWTCTDSDGAGTANDCGSGAGANSGTGNLSRNDVTLAASGSVTYTLNLTFDSGTTAAPLALNASAQTSAGGSTAVTTSRSLTRVPESDVSVTKTSTGTSYTPGGAASYTVIVRNDGPTDVTGVTLTDTAPAGMTIGTWTCSASNVGSPCPAASGSGNLAVTGISLVSGRTLTYTLAATFAASATANPLTNTATITVPVAAGDPDSTDHTDSVSKTRNALTDWSVAFSPASPSGAGSPATFVPGSSGSTLAATFTNLGPANSGTASASVTLPAAVSGGSWACAICTPASGVIDDSTASVTTTVPARAVNASATLTLTLNYASSAVASTISFVGSIAPTVASGDTDPVTPNNSATNVHEADRQADIQVTKTASRTSVGPGDGFFYDIKIRNNGPSDAGQATGETGLLLTDDFDARLRPDATICAEATEPCWRYCSGSTGDLVPGACGAESQLTGIGDIIGRPFALAAGAARTVRVFVAVATTVADGTTIPNSASVAIDTAGTPAIRKIEGSPATPDSASVNVDVAIASDLRVTKNDGVTQAVPGVAHSYQVVVSNPGRYPVNGAKVNDAFPIFSTGNAGYVSGSTGWQCLATSGACCNSNSTSCGVGTATPRISTSALTNQLVDLAPGASMTFTVSGTLDRRSTGFLTNTATVALPAGTDANPADNTATDNNTVMQAASSLSIAKRLLSVSDIAGTTRYLLDYEIVVGNAGPSQVSNVAVSDPLNDVQLNAAGATWTCAATTQPAGGTTNCDAASGSGALSTTVDLDVGGQIRIAVQVETVDGASGEVANLARAALGTDIVESEVRSGLSGESELSITKTDGRTEVVAGEATEYFVTVRNDGPDDVFGARVIDLLPPSLDNISWTCAATTPIPGDLTVFGDVAGMGLVGPGNTSGGALVTSADGRHIYQLAPAGQSLIAFDRENIPGPTFGRVAALEVETEAVNDSSDPGLTVSGMQAPTDLAISSDGRAVYVLSQALGANPASIAMFSRISNVSDPAYGKLSFATKITTGVPAFPKRIVARAGFLYVSAAGGISIFSLDALSGAPTLDSVHTANLPVTPTALALTSDGNRLAIGTAGSTGPQIALFNISAGGLTPAGRLDFIANLSHGDLNGISDLAFAPGGKHLYAAATASSRLSQVLVDATTLTIGVTVANTALDSIRPAGMGNPFAAPMRLAIANDGEHLIVSSQIGGDPLINMRRELDAGILTAEAIILRSALATTGTLPDDVAFSADGRQFFVASDAATDAPLAVYDRTAPDPLFALIDVDRQGQGSPAISGINAPADVAISPDGKHLYAVSLGGDNALAVFDRHDDIGADGAPGKHLQFNRAYFDGQGGMQGLDRPRRVVLSADGSQVFVTSSDANTLAIFNRNASDGSLTLAQPVFRDNQGGVTALSGASGLAVDASGTHLYVAAFSEQAIGMFRRTAGTWAFFGEQRGGVSGVTGLQGVRDVALSRDDGQLVAVSWGSGSGGLASVFNRDASGVSPSFGALTFVHAMLIGAAQPMSIVMPRGASDDQHIYIAAEGSDAIVVMRRITDPGNPAFGRVEPFKIYSAAANGIPELDGAHDVALSRDGKRLYVAARFASSVLVFDRDLNRLSGDFGSLNLVEARTDGVDGVDGLARVYAVAVSGDGRNVYTAGFDDRAIGSFAVGSGSTCSAGGSGSIDDLVNIGAGGTLRYRIAATLRSDASGFLRNTASVELPARWTDNNLANNEKEDLTDIVARGDLSIFKTDGQVSVVAGDSTRYTVTISNPGPSNLGGPGAPAVRVTDLFSAAAGFVPASASWTCRASGSGTLDFVGTQIRGTSAPPLLDGATAIAVINNAAGSFTAVASVVDNSVTLFRRNPADGTLSSPITLKQGDTLPNVAGGSTTVSTLAGPTALVASANGRRLYVASRDSDAVTVLQVESGGSAGFAWIGAETSPSLDQAQHLVLSPNGANLYVAAANADTVTVWTVDAVSGGITLLETEFNGIDDPSDAGPTVAGLGNVEWLTVSPDGAQLYALSGQVGGIARFDRDPANGKLSFRALRTGADFAVSLAGVASGVFDADGRYLYLTVAGANRVVILERDLTAGSTLGALAYAGTVAQGVDGVSGLQAPRRAVLSPDGNHLYVTAQSGNSIAWFVRDPLDGSLAFIGQRSNESVGVSGLGGASGVAISSDGASVYVAAVIDDAVVHLQRQNDSECPASGTGPIDQLPVRIAAGGQVTFTITVATQPDFGSDFVNVATVASTADADVGNNSSTDIDARTASADLSITKTDGVAEYDGLAVATAVAGDDTQIFVAGSTDDAIGIFDRESNPAEPDFGLVSYRGVVRDGTDGVLGLGAVSDLELTADGKHLYAVSPEQGSISAFARASDGSLGYLQIAQNGILGVTGLSGARAVDSSPDGAHLYVASRFSNAVAVFARGTDSAAGNFGRLSFLQSLQNGVGGVGGIEAPIDIAVAPDGLHVYVLAATGDALTVFSRNPNSGSGSYGRLIWLASLRNGVGGVTGLQGVRSLAISPDGSQVYALAAGEGAIARFARAADGRLTQSGVVRNGEAGISGLSGAAHISIPADGTELFVSSHGQIGSFAIEASGSLTAFQAIANGDPAPQTGGQVFGLAGAGGILRTPDGEQVVAVSSIDSALTVFDRNPADRSLDFAAALIDGLGGVAPGESLTYRILVTNNGPSAANRARIRDVFPSQFDSVSWSCQGSGGATCPVSGSGDVDIEASMPVGSRVLVLATGQISSGATGRMVNTATVEPIGAQDPLLSNNSATDNDTVLSAASNLVVTVDDGQTSAVPGLPIAYQIGVTNLGPTYATAVRIDDLLPAALYGASWTCSATPVAGALAAVQSLTTPLSQVRDFAIGGNGRFAYAVGQAGSAAAIGIYSRDPLTGSLTSLAAIADGTPGITGIGGATALALSPDDRFVYVAGAVADSIALFRRDASSGGLTFVASWQDGALGVQGLGGVSDLIVSPGGGHLYAAGSEDDAIAIFSINPTDGRLSYSGALFQGQGGINGLNGVRHLAISAEGTLVLAAAGANQSLAVFARASNGNLSLLKVVEDFELAASASGALVDPSSLTLYGSRAWVTSASSGRATAFDVDAAGNPVLAVALGGDGSLPNAAGVAFDPDQARLYVAASDGIAFFSLINTLPQRLAQSAALVDAQRLVLAGDARQLYAVELGQSTLSVYSRERGSRCQGAGTGSLAGMLADISPGGMLSIQLQATIFANATGSLRYSVSAQTPVLAQELNPADNTAVDIDQLTPVADLGVSKSDGLSSVVAGTPISWQIDVSNGGVSDAVAARLTDTPPYFPAVTAGLLAGSGNMQCSANPPIEVAQSLLLDQPASIALSPDGLQAFVASPANGGALLVMSRDGAGALALASTIVEGQASGSGAVSGLGGASAVAITPDGRHVLVTGQTANSLVVFDRDTATGALVFNQVFKSGVNGVLGLLGPVDVKVAPNGRWAFVASPGSDAIASFRIDATTGQLSFVERIRDGFGTFDLESNVIRGVRQLAVDASSSRLYAVATTSDTLSSYAIAPTAGTLDFVSVSRNGAAGVGPLVDPLALTFVPGGEELLVLSSTAVHRFDVDAGAAPSLIATHPIADPNGAPRALAIDASGSRVYVALAQGGIRVIARHFESGLLSARQDVGVGSLPAATALAVETGELITLSPTPGVLTRFNELALSRCIGANGPMDTLDLGVDVGIAGWAQIDFSARVHPSARGILTNTAAVAPAQGSDPVAANNSSTDSTTIQVVSDLSISKTGPTFAIAGEALQYRIVISNAGPSSSLGAQLVDVLPVQLLNAAWTCVASTGNSCPATGSGNASFAFDLLPNGSLTIDIAGTINPAFIGALSNTATLTPEAGATDPTPNDHTASSPVADVVARANVSIAKTNGVDGLLAGQLTTWTIDVANAGPSHAPQVAIQDLLPAGVLAANWTCVAQNGAACPATGTGNVGFNANLPAGSSIKLQVTGRIDPALEVDIENTATAVVAAPAEDPQPANNTASDADSVTIAADLEVQILTPLNPYDPGGVPDLPFDVEIENLGPSLARAVTLSMQIPVAGSQFLPAGCTIELGTQVDCVIGDLSPGTTVTRAFRLRFLSLDEQPTSFDIHAEVAGRAEAEDPQLANNVADASIRLASGVDIVTSISNGVDFLQANQLVTYDIRVRNDGSVTGAAVDVSVPVADGLIDATWTCTGAAGAVCPASGGGDFNEQISLSRGQSILLRLRARVSTGLDPSQMFLLTQTVEAQPSGQTDIRPADNIAIDADPVSDFLFIDGFEGPTPPLAKSQRDDPLRADECALYAIRNRSCSSPGVGQ